MDDLLFIILTLIIAGVGSLGQLKKKKQLQRSSASTIKTPDDIWRMIKNNAEMSPFDTKLNEAKEVFVKEPGPAVNEQNYSFNPNNEGGKVFETNIAKPAVRPKKKSVFNNNFSIRDAVIYNEILNHKYF